MKQYTWNVMVIVDGYDEVHTEDLSEQGADELVKRLKNFFPDNDYYAQQVEYIPPVYPHRHYNNNAVDGWEDIYPDRD
jgi:hypothetical protein